jgi:hypothetical protein
MLPGGGSKAVVHSEFAPGPERHSLSFRQVERAEPPVARVSGDSGPAATLRMHPRWFPGERGATPVAVETTRQQLRRAY